MEYGYAKLGRRYALVEIESRIKLPKVQAVRWRFVAEPDEPLHRWMVTESRRVRKTLPATKAQKQAKAKEKWHQMLNKAFAGRWKSIGPWSIGRWRTVKANQNLELRQLRPRVWQARRKEN